MNERIETILSYSLQMGDRTATILGLNELDTLLFYIKLIVSGENVKLQLSFEIYEYRLYHDDTAKLHNHKIKLTGDIVLAL